VDRQPNGRHPIQIKELAVLSLTTFPLLSHAMVVLLLIVIGLGGMAPAYGVSGDTTRTPVQALTPAETTTPRSLALPVGPDSLQAPSRPGAPSSKGRGFAQQVIVSPLGNEQAVNRPYRQETSVYRSTPAIRYNRVEGAVLGLRRSPLTWDDASWVGIYGQAGYASGIERPRSAGGIEVRLVQPSAGSGPSTGSGERSGYGLKVGVRGELTTATQDAWKRSWSENSVAMLLRGDDSFGYYETRGAAVYVVQRFARWLQVTLDGRWNQHDALPVTTRWSLLGDPTVDPNAFVEDAEIRVARLTVEAGALRKPTEHRSTGTIGRLQAELGSAFDAPNSFDRLVVDVQTFQPIGAFNINVRGRAGAASDDAPEQMRFRLDGVRGLRSYTPDARTSPRMVLAGVQIVRYGLPGVGTSGWSSLEPVHLSAFTDAGRTTTETFAFAGLGASIFGGFLSTEIAWPLHREGLPQLTLKVHPLR